MLNVKNQIVKFIVQIRHVLELTVQNVLPYVKHHIVLLIANHLNQNVKQFVMNQNVIGNVINQNAQNQNVNWFVKTLDVNNKPNVVNVNKHNYIYN